MIAMLKERAQEFAANGEIDKAIVIMKDCIEESLKKQGTPSFDPVAVVDLQTSLAELFLRLKPNADESSAIDALTKALQVLLAHNANGKLNAKIATVNHTLGTIYLQSHKFKEALNCFTEVATIWEAARNRNLLGLYHLYNTMAEIQEKLGFFKRAQEQLEKSLQVLKEIYQGQERPEMATVIYNIAQQLLKQGAYDHALQQCTKALSLYKREYGEVSSQVLSCLHLAAAIHKHKRDIDEMEKTFADIFSRQQELYKAKLGTGDKTAATTIAMSQHQAALYFLEMKRMDKVLTYCRKAIDFLLENGGENTFTHASLLHTMSAACSGLKNFQEAKDYAEKELQIMQKLYPEGSQELAHTYSNLITIYLRLRDNVAATVLIEKEMNILKKIYGENHPQVLKKRRQYDNILAQLSNRPGSHVSSSNSPSQSTTTTPGGSLRTPPRQRTLSVPLPKYQQ